VADYIADDENGGILGPLSGQVEVAAYVFGDGGQESRCEVQAGPLRQHGRGKRIPDRAQVPELMLGRIEMISQRGGIVIMQGRLIAKARYQCVLTALSIVGLSDIAPLLVDLEAQLPKLAFVSLRIIAHVGSWPCQASRGRPHRAPLRSRLSRNSPA
jgi:hypothetical protein